MMPSNTATQCWRANITTLSSSTLMWSLCSERVQTPTVWESPMYVPQPWVESSVKIVNSARKGRIGIPALRNETRGPSIGTLMCNTKFSGRIFGTCVLLSPEPWIMGGKLSPNPSITKAPETGYPELVLIKILLSLTGGLPCSVCVITETGAKVTLDSLNGVSTSRLDTELPISPYDGGKLQLCVRSK